MIYIFYFLVLFLLGSALAFVMPGLRGKPVKLKCFMAVFILGSVLSIYQFLGRAEALKEYYSEHYVASRQKKSEIRPMMALLRKEEYKLRMGLGRDPQNVDLRLRWLDITAILALEAQDPDQAKRCWQEALRLIPKNKAHRAQRSRIQELLAQLDG